MHNILIRPLLTEKMTDLTENEKKYGFVVDINSNKIQIAKAIEEKFDVNDVLPDNEEGPDMDELDDMDMDMSFGDEAGLE